ncbi:MAG TPA: mercuric ion transporter MerT [Polaromonas sp.]|uniref:mercuric ion transporter MerT n=1 Tax=Polaromonas sp. UBA4122 TaxID=1947074 RepID=UPI000EEC741E|nr:mercuric ion transporter MerT [Polaromonas sp. UBA4122]HAL36821.1 mercuric ion transporter MerT [Polaromonas sp.]
MNALQAENTSDKTFLRTLLAGGLAALFASTCCLGPLVLITLGLSGAWISKLTVLEPYQPIFIGAALVALFFAGKRIWRPAAQCAPGEVCALPRVKRAYKLLFLGVCTLVLLTLVFPLIAPWFY